MFYKTVCFQYISFILETIFIDARSETLLGFPDHDLYVGTGLYLLIDISVITGRLQRCATYSEYGIYIVGGHLQDNTIGVQQFVPLFKHPTPCTRSGKLSCCRWIFYHPWQTRCCKKNLCFSSMLFRYSTPSSFRNCSLDSLKGSH